MLSVQSIPAKWTTFLLNLVPNPRRKCHLSLWVNHIQNFSVKGFWKLLSWIYRKMYTKFISKIYVKSVYFFVCPLLPPSQSHRYLSPDCCQSLLSQLPLLAQQQLFIPLWIKPKHLRPQSTKKLYRLWALFIPLPFWPHLLPLS